MIFVKLAILLWVAFLIIRFFVGLQFSVSEKISLQLGQKIKMTFSRWLMVIVFLLALADSFAALIWILFFR